MEEALFLVSLDVVVVVGKGFFVVAEPVVIVTARHLKISIWSYLQLVTTGNTVQRPHLSHVSDVSTYFSRFS